MATPKSYYAILDHGCGESKGSYMARADFHWDDPLLLERQLTDEEKMPVSYTHLTLTTTPYV